MRDLLVVIFACTAWFLAGFGSGRVFQKIAMDTQRVEDFQAEPKEPKSNLTLGTPGSAWSLENLCEFHTDLKDKYDVVYFELNGWHYTCTNDGMNL